MTASEILEKYINFFQKQDHVQIANSSLVPENDPTTLFTSSGMQPLVPYLLGQKHQSGNRLVNVQNCFRAQDIDEIGDNRHTTFFRMLGNWSLGDYFKKEQINWIWEFLTGELGLDKNKLYISVFEGFKNIPKDTESYEIWAGLLKKDGLKPEERIFYYGVDKNWWSRSGTPDKMPIGEPGGPDTEVFYDFETEHDPEFGDKCHVNCDCGRYLEIGNSVFMQYVKTEKGFQDLPKQNVDFGGGLERLVAATENKQDIFETTEFKSIIKLIESASRKSYIEYPKPMRIIADHLRAAIFIIADGVEPSTKGRGSVLRKLIYRGIDAAREIGIENNLAQIVGSEFLKINDEILGKVSEQKVLEALDYEEGNYKNKLNSAVPQAEKTIDQFLSRFDNGPSFLPMGIEAAKIAFNLYQSHGLPEDYFINLFLSKLQNKFTGLVYPEFELKKIEDEFKKLREEQKEQSRKASVGMFKGGLADHSEKTIMGHTATHLLHKTLRDMFGESLHQAGSNITPERVRFDYNFDRKLTPEEIKKIEDTVNEKIKKNLPVHFEIMPLSKAKEIGAIGLFDEKYSDNVKVYFVGDYSAEFCGGPHVDFTGEIKRFKIIKEEALGRSLRRIYAVVGD